MPAQKPLKIFFHAMDGPGHLNACLGLAQALASRDHQIIFLLNGAFEGQFAKFGFEEILLTKSPPPQFAQNDFKQSDKPMSPVKMGAMMILKSGILGPKSPLEKLRQSNGKGNEQFIKTLYDSLLEFNPQIEKAIKREQPDLIILDHFLIPPVVLQMNIPWVNLCSGNPLSLHNSTRLPPSSSGYPTDSDPLTWKEFRSLRLEFYRQLSEAQTKLCVHFNHELAEEDNPIQHSFPRSKHLNIYGYPQELDYQDVTDSKNTFRLDTFCRTGEDTFDLPEGFVQPGDQLIYFSLGSMGSVDVELMKRIVTVLGKTQYKCIVSKGPLADEYELPVNCWGRAYLPQTRILPLVDLVITHGGNNTVTESFSFGKPMIVMPLFGDQYDNAQRVHEKNYGVRLEPYTFQESQLIESIDKLLDDKALHERLQAAVKRIESANSKVKACERIEKLVQKC